MPHGPQTKSCTRAQEQHLLQIMYWKYDVREEGGEAGLAWSFLRRLPSEDSLTVHLRHRRIESIRLISEEERWPIADVGKRWEAAISPLRGDRLFRIFLVTSRSVRRLMQATGHEVGHTYFYHPNGTSLARVLNARPTIPAEERICDLFGAEWLYWFPRSAAELKLKLKELLTNNQCTWVITP